MMRLALLLLLAAAAFGQDADVQTPATKALAAELTRIEQESGGQLGLAAICPETNLRIGWRATDRFPLAELYHLPVALRVIGLMEAGLLPFRKMVKVEPENYVPGHSPIRERYPEGAVLTIGQLLRYAIAENDATAAAFLLSLSGGTPPLKTTLERLVKDGIRIDRTAKETRDDFDKRGPVALAMDPRDSATPEAYTALLTMVHRRQLLKPKPSELLLTWMTEASQCPNRLKALLPADVQVWHLPGTGGTKDKLNLCTSDAGGIVLPGDQGHILLSVFLKLSPQDEAAREKTLAEAARAVYRFFTTPQ
ncbi:serine hydrolase [Paludibaculum fermentans]|uniref:beta-lactamase n=1 Tax=Paludibaculum fermentans TaxID=1473598 RepID=A0A7S7NNY8_PALFE|nr:serine hydrolase [Paludibaculum fermentans]QOY87122.1 serine hydrolase [Paludibaculum fermentans]